MSIENVIVIGIGKVGSLVAELLSENFKVTKADSIAKDDVIKLDVKDKDLKDILKNYDAVISCLPYNLNLNIAKIADELAISYFDLTEDVETTSKIKNFKNSKYTAPQCGLAPGFISIIGADLAKKFDEVRFIELRVGALPQHPKGELGYAFNWSKEGVVNEYLNDCEVIQDGVIKKVPAMQDVEKIVISGNSLECFNTSGGLGTMCESFEGKVQELNYKTMRYPGHCKLMRFFFDELNLKDNRDLAGEILVKAKPPVREDVVYVHAAAEGKKGNEYFREEFVRTYLPKRINGQDYRAISWTTASSISAVVELAAKGKIKPGFIYQEQINLDDFFATKHGSFLK